MKKQASILEVIIVLCFFIMLFITFSGVIARYFFNRPITFIEELARILLINIVLLGATINSRNKSHLRVDVFYNILFSHSHRIRKKIDLAIDIIIIFAITSLLYYGIILMYISRRQYTTVLSIPFPIVYSIIPLMSAIILIYYLRGVIGFIKNNIYIRGFKIWKSH